MIFCVKLIRKILKMRFSKLKYHLSMILIYCIINNMSLFLSTILIYLIALRSPPGQSHVSQDVLRVRKKNGRKMRETLPVRTETKKVTHKSLWKIDPQIEENRPKRVPKSSQTGPKIEPRATRNQNRILRASWERPGSGFPGYRAVT